MSSNEITIDGVVYVRKDSIRQDAQELEGLEGLPYKIVRGDRSGVFAGYLKERRGTEAHLLQVRRLWHWEGAASLSQLAEEGVSKPNDCKFPIEMKEDEVLDALEIINVSERARLSIAGVPIWKA